MRKLLLSCSILLVARLGSAAPLNRSVFTEVVQDVSILDATTRKPRSVKVNDTFSTPDILRTGPNSRAELIAEDKTVTRVGANTIFSFEANKREINLKQGNVLFNSPSGKGGGTIRTAAATAAVLGTTLVVSATPNGGFKVLMVEGRGQISSGGSARQLGAGQMTFVLPGQQGLSPAYNFQLKEQVGNSKLIKGFKAPLQSIAKVEAAVTSQEKKIAKGSLAQTNLLATDTPGVARAVDPAVIGNLQVLVAGGESDIASRLARGEIGPDDTAIVSDPALDPNRILSGSGAAAFIAGNTIFRTSNVDLSGLGPSFAFLSTNDLRFESQLSITGQSGGTLSFLAGGTISNASGATVELENDATLLASLGSSSADPVDPAVLSAGSGRGNAVLSDFAFANLGGSLEVDVPSLTLDNAGLWAGTDLNIFTGNFSVANGITSLESWGDDDDSGTQFERSPRSADSRFKRGTALEAGNNLSIQTTGNFRAVRTDLVGETIRIQSGNEIQLEAVRISNRDFDAGRSAAILAANNLVNVSGARFQVGLVNINARTINLSDVRFAEGSRVRLFCESGRYTLDGNRPVEGRVNFRDVSYGSEDIAGELSKGGASQVQVRRR